MSREVKIIIVVVLALIIAKVILLLLGRKERQDTQIFILWTMLLAASALTKSIFAVLGLIILIKFFYLKNDQEKNITAYFALWAILPFHYVITNFPTPSLPLMGANYQRLLTLVWVAPLLPTLLSQARESQRKVIFDLPFLIFLILAVKLEFSPKFEFPPTVITSIKSTMNLTIDYVIPYFVIVTWANSWARVKKILWALFLGALVFAILAFVEAFKGWNIFHELGYEGMKSVRTYSDYRGFLRTKVTFPDPLSYGVYGIMMLGVAVAILFRSKRKILVSLFVLLLFLGTIYLTHSRGDWVGAAFMVVFFLFFRMRTFSRLFYIFVLVITIPVVGLLQSEHFATGTRLGIDDVDQFGSFEYRKKLFLGMLEILPRHPWFGNSMYKAEPEMQALVTGQGIVDPVNTYMKIAVERGLIALFFFLFVIIRSINTGLRYIKYGFSRNNLVWVHVGAALAALVSGMAIALTFTSFFATIVVYFWIAMGIARAMQLNLEKRLVIRAEKLSDEWEVSRA